LLERGSLDTGARAFGALEDACPETTVKEAFIGDEKAN
jgi:hypothetical protein